MVTIRSCRWGLGVAGAVAVALCAATLLAAPPSWLGSTGRAAADTGAAVRARRAAVTARGRLQPAGGVIRVAGPSRPGAVIETLYVHEGDWVEAGQLIAVLDGSAPQEAVVRRLSVEAKHAATELNRFERLYRDGIVSTAERDTAEMQVGVAQAELTRAPAELDTGHVRAPTAGRVLIIHTHAGERIGPDGVLDLGNTARMEVVAEIYETDVASVYTGQPATVSAAALDGSLTGAVERIGLTIGKQTVFDLNPVADADARVVEVHIRLDDAARAAALTNLQVDVDLAA